MHGQGTAQAGGVGRTLLGWRSVNCTQGAKPRALGARREPQESQAPHTEPPGPGARRDPHSDPGLRREELRLASWERRQPLRVPPPPLGWEVQDQFQLRRPR